MRHILISIVGLLAASCATSPSYQYLKGGETVDQPGISFVLPAGHNWAAIMRSTYQSAFGAMGMPRNYTIIVSSTVYNFQPTASKEEFLRLVREGRASEPKTGRFEEIRNTEQLYEDRSETCVIYRSSSKDFGAEAKRGGEYSVLETIGIHCVHPDNPNVGMQIEFSRKAPPETTYPSFEDEGLALIRSVKLGEF